MSTYDLSGHFLEETIGNSAMMLMHGAKYEES